MNRTLQRLDRTLQQIQSVDKAARLLRALCDSNDAMTVGQLSVALDVHKSTVSRLIATLLQHELVAEAGGSRGYRVGPAVLRLASSAARESQLIPVVRPIMEWLAERTGESVNLAVLRGNSVYHLDQIQTSHYVGAVDWIGRFVPTHVSSTGRVLLATAERRIREAVLGEKLEALTPQTKTNVEELREVLEHVADVGYAVVEDELELGLVAIAAPVIGVSDDTWAAVSVSGPESRISGDRRQQVITDTVQAASQMSERIGGGPFFQARWPSTSHEPS